MSEVPIQFVLWLLLAVLTVEGQQDRLPRRPTVKYNDRVKFSDLTNGQTFEVSRADGGERLHFRTLVFSGSSSELYVGGREALYAVNSTNMNILGNVMVNTDPGSEAFCSSSVSGQANPYLCHNYVSIVQPLGQNCLFVCGTDATRPSCYFVDTTDYSKRDADARFSSDSGAPGEPNQNISWIYLAEEQKLFTAVGRERFSLAADPNFRLANLTGCSMMGYTTPDVTADSTSTWMNIPEFVGDPFEDGGYIYFFYREYASEAINGGRIIYSRVARVCKNDTGGPEFTTLQYEFTTFQKARLDCSLKEGNLDFDYNEIQGTYKSGQTIFAVFTTPRTGLASSAVCAYNVEEIVQLFNEGKAKGQNLDSELWIIPDKDKVYIPPDVFDCANLPYVDSAFPFLQKYPLKNKPVPNKLNYKDMLTNDYTRPSDAPLFVMNDVRLSQIVVDEDVTNGVDVFFLGTERGTVMKAYMNPSSNDPEVFLIEEIDFNQEGMPEAPILRMVRNSMGDLFVGTDNSVYRLPVESCSSKSSCECSKNLDPYCECNGDECRRKNGGSTLLCNPNCTAAGVNMTVTRHEPCSKCYTSRCPDTPCHTFVPTNSISYLNFAAYAPEGSSLSASEVQCGCQKSSADQTILSVCSGNEFVTVNVAVHVTSQCNCSMNFSTDSGAVESLTTAIFIDDSSPQEGQPCFEAAQRYDNEISFYKHELNNWKNREINLSQCEQENGIQMGYCKEGSDCYNLS